ARVELPGGADQAEVPLADQVLDAQAPAGVLAGDLHHQPEVGPDHPGPRLAVAPGDRLGHGPLLLPAEQRGAPDCVEADVQAGLVATGLSVRHRTKPPLGARGAGASRGAGSMIPPHSGRGRTAALSADPALGRGHLLVAEALEDLEDLAPGGEHPAAGLLV